MTGLGESQLDDKIAPIYGEYTNPSTTILFTDSEVEIHLAATAETEARAQELVEELTDKLEEAIGQNVYSTRGESLEEVLGLRLRLMTRPKAAVSKGTRVSRAIEATTTRISTSSHVLRSSMVCRNAPV